MQKKQIMDKLTEVLDPELNISIVDLGLVYDVKPQKNKVEILMTLTTIGCPLFGLIEEEVRDKLTDLGFDGENVKIKLTFDPPWSMERMSERAKAIIGI